VPAVSVVAVGRAEQPVLLKELLQIVQLPMAVLADCTAVVVVAVPLPLIVTAQVAAAVVRWLISITIQ
jgi:hypothetical protein